MFTERSGYIKNPILEMDALAAELSRKGKDVIKLNRGDPPLYFKTPAYMIDAYIEALKENKTNYSSASGTAELKEAVSRRYKRMYGISVDHQGIIATAGVTEALSFINHAMIEKGDSAILFRPHYPQYLPRLMSENGKPVYCDQLMEQDWDVHLEGFERTIAALKRIGRIGHTKYVIVTNPCNPTGKTIPRKTLARIAELANENNLLIISDEIYDEIVYHGAKFTSMSEAARGIPHMLLNGSSKNYDSTGFRVGFIIIPGNDKASVSLKEKFTDYALTRLSINTPAQHAVAEGINNVKEHGKAIKAMVKGMQERAETTVKAIRENSHLEVVMPDSTFYVFPRIRLQDMDFRTGDEFVKSALIEEGVQLTRGSAFGAPSNFRVVALPPSSVLEEAMSRINRMCARHSKKH